MLSDPYDTRPAGSADVTEYTEKYAGSAATLGVMSSSCTVVSTVVKAPLQMRICRIPSGATFLREGSQRE